MNKIKRPFSIKSLYILAGLIILVIGLYLVYNKYGSKNITKVTNVNPQNVSYPGPTDQEKKETEENKKNVEQRLKTEEKPVADNPPVVTVKPIISSWGQTQTTKDLEVGAYIPNIYEDGGICTLIITGGSQEITESRKSEKNVSNTTCGIITISRHRLATGTWKVIVRYSSPRASGVSDQTEIRVE